MISAGDIRNGITFEMDGKVMQVIEFQHVKPGKGAAFVRVKMRNVITGGVTETSLNPLFRSHPIPYKPGEHSGGYYEIREVEVETKNGAKETIEVQIDYKIWYKFVD